MSWDKEKTLKYIKKKHKVSQEKVEETKEFMKIRKAIAKALSDGPKTIPQIAKIMGLPLADVTYNVMTCRKYGYIEETGEISEDDYHYYELKGRK